MNLLISALNLYLQTLPPSQLCVIQYVQVKLSEEHNSIQPYFNSQSSVLYLLIGTHDPSVQRIRPEFQRMLLVSFLQHKTKLTRFNTIIYNHV